MKKLKKLIAVIIILVLILLGIMYTHKFIPTLSSSLMISSHTDSAPVLVAHRGLSSLYPENTLAAFEGAGEYGFEYCELDIHTTKDGKWVVIHDDTVDKMTDGEGKVSSFTAQEIKSLKIDAGNGIENHADLGVPTLEQSIEVCLEAGTIPVVEIKGGDPIYFADLKKILDKYDLSEKAKIISFNKEFLEKYREADPEIDMLYLSNIPTVEDIDWCIDHNFGINFNFSNFYKCFSAISYARENSVTIAAWTVDNTLYADIMTLFGAKYITTNKILP